MSIQKILLSFTPQPENLLPLLHEVNASFGYISKEHAYKIADYFGIAPARLYGVVTASSLLKVEKPAALEVAVCTGEHCGMKGAWKVLREAEKFLKTKVDKKRLGVSLKTMSCIGRCEGSPVMKVNGTVFSKVRPELIDDILAGYL